MTVRLFVVCGGGHMPDFNIPVPEEIQDWRRWLERAHAVCETGYARVDRSFL